MDYYLKYIKYKNKYLLLKGGKIPEIKEHKESKQKYLPLNYSINKLILNKKVIKDGEMPIYNLNSNFEYEVNDTHILPNIVKNYYLFYNDIIRINDNEIPFETLFLENSFNIIFKLYELLTNEYTEIIFKKFVENIKNEDKILIDYFNAIIKDNNCNEEIYNYNERISSNLLQEKIKYDYILFKKNKLEDNIIFLNKNKLVESLDDNHNKVLQLKSEITNKDLRKMILSNDIEKLKNDMKDEELKKYDYNDETRDYIKKVNIHKIKNNTIEKKKLDVEINSIICENKLKMDIDKNISEIIYFKSIVNNDTYDEIVKGYVKIEIEKKITIIKNIYKKYFNMDFYNNTCIGISVKPNILNKYIFINKFRELLEILYSDSNTENEIETQILNLYGNNKEAFINISDMMELYKNAIDSNQYITDDQIQTYSLNINKKTNTEKKIKAKYNAYIKNEIKLIMELKEFIKYCDIIDNTDGLNDFIKIKTSIIFFASFIGEHFKKITFPKIDNFLFPTNIDNIICNLLNIQTDKLKYIYDELITNELKRNNDNDINKTKIQKIQIKIQKIKSKISTLYKYDTLINKKKDSSYEEWSNLGLNIDDLRLDYSDFKKKYDNSNIFYKMYKYNKKLDDKYNYNLSKIKIMKNIYKVNKQKLELFLENEIKYTNYNLFNVSNLPKIFKYSIAVFEDNKFPDCVENTLLHFVRAIIWDPKSINYNYDFLPKTSIPELKDFVKLLKTGNENTQKIKNNFNKLIQNKEQFIDLYKKNANKKNYEIKSNIVNFKTFLNYLFGITVGDCIQYKYPNINIKEIKEDNSTIYIEYNKLSYILGFHIYNGHSMVTKNITNPAILSKYTYINLIYLLSSDYINHKITNFNIYDDCLHYYIDKKPPFFLIVLLLDHFVSTDPYLSSLIMSHINDFLKIFNYIEKQDLKNLISKQKLYINFMYEIYFMLLFSPHESDFNETINKYLSYLKFFNLKSDTFFILINDVLLKKLDNDINKKIINYLSEKISNDNNIKIYFKVSIFDYLCLNYDFDRYNDNSKNKLIKILNELLDNYSNRNDILNERKLDVYDDQYELYYPESVSINIKELLLKDNIRLE
jgi:hypothetical protein